MTQQEIRTEFDRLYGVGDAERLKGLEVLRAAAEQSGLSQWVTLINARIALVADRFDEAIHLSTQLISAAGTDLDVAHWARNNRGAAYNKKHQNDEAIADFAAVIESPDAPADQKTWARYNRGVTYREKGQTDEAIADCTAVIEAPDASSDQKAKARLYRGLAYGEKGQSDEEIADYTAVIEAPDASADQKVRARLCRGYAYDSKGRTDEAIADYTAVIEAPDASADQKAVARVNRGWAYSNKGQTDKAIADYTVVIEAPDAPADQKAGARINRGVAYLYKGQTDEATADFTAVIEARDTTARDKARARIGRGFAYGNKGQTDEAVADYTAVIQDPEAPPDLKRLATLMGGASVAGGEATPAAGMAELPALIDTKTGTEFKEALEKGRQQRADFFSESLFRTDASFLLVLREWNSYTPALPREGDPARGGGYFIKHRGTGIVIDPGFDFLKIFSEAGGRLCDIDHIVITHAHNDHTADLESIMMLLYEFNDLQKEKGTEKRSVNLFLSQGVARKFAGLLPLRGCDHIGELVTLNRGKPKDPQVIRLSNDISLTVLPAYHDDIVTKDYAVGLGFELNTGDPVIVRRLLFTGDTAILPSSEQGSADLIHSVYPEPFCDPGKTDLLIAHIGTIGPEELEHQLQSARMETATQQTGVPYYTKHLGFLGTYRLLHDLRPKAAIVSEFGEEMKTIWIEAVGAIDQKLGEVLPEPVEVRTRVFAGDPIVIYDLQRGMFLCHQDCDFHPSHKLITDPVKGKDKNARPYLLLRGTDRSRTSAIQSRIDEFHDALRERRLPHFAPKRSR